MKEQIISTLHELRRYALDKGYVVSVLFREEDSNLMRFANSAISLNTNEHLIRIEVTAYEGKKRASYEMITSLDQLDIMKKGVDTAAEMVKHAMPLDYNPTIPLLDENFSDESGYDASLASMTNSEKLEFLNQVSKGLETPDIKLGGIFSSGTNVQAEVSTLSDKSLYIKFTDTQVNAVLSHEQLKWEVIAEQSAQQKSDLNPTPLHEDLSFLLDHYQHDKPQQLPLGTYDIVFGAAAIADMLHFFHYIGFDGGMMKRGYSFLTPEQIGKKVFSEQVSLYDDANDRRTFPYKRDLLGMKRNTYPLVEKGVFRGFEYVQDEADEFGEIATGHTVYHDSLVMKGGSQKVQSLKELVNQPRDNDLLYFPFIHYMYIVNPSKGVITGSSRFGALLLKKDGSIVVPYNYRITQSLLDIFGDKVAWVSSEVEAYNISSSYAARNPQAIVVPKFMRVNGLEISHSNSSY
jgi:predicted Zn-dependent protease